MIASRNSLSYLRAKNPLYEAVSLFWRCQHKDLSSQNAAGVKFFDIHIALSKKNGLTFVCGKVELDSSDFDFYELVHDLESAGCYYRVTLEYGEEYVEKWFTAYMNRNISILGLEHCAECVINRTKETVYKKEGTDFVFVDKTVKPEGFKKNVSKLLSNIRNYDELDYPCCTEITDYKKREKKKVFVFDFV